MDRLPWSCDDNLDAKSEQGRSHSNYMIRLFTRDCLQTWYACCFMKIKIGKFKGRAKRRWIQIHSYRSREAKLDPNTKPRKQNIRTPRIVQDTLLEGLRFAVAHQHAVIKNSRLTKTAAETAAYFEW